MEFSAHLAGRYLRSRRHSRFLSRGSTTAIAGIAIGVMVLNITLAVMNGFHAEMRRTFVENMPMVSVITSRPAGFTELGALMDSIAADPEVGGVTPCIRQEVLISAVRRGGATASPGRRGMGGGARLDRYGAAHEQVSETAPRSSGQPQPAGGAAGDPRR